MVYSIRDASRQGPLAVQGKEDDGGVEESQGTFVIGLNRRAEDFTNTWQHHLTSPSIFTQPNFSSSLNLRWSATTWATIQPSPFKTFPSQRSSLTGVNIAKIARMVKIARIARIVKIARIARMVQIARIVKIARIARMI